MKIILVIKIGFWFIFLTGFVSFCGCMIEKSETESETGVGTGINNALLLQLVNSYRTAGCDCGSKGYFNQANPVVWSDTLELIAYDHCKDMYKNRFLNHTGSDGSNPGTRLKSRGYEWSTYGENIAQGYSTEKSVMEGLIKSPEHCNNIMNPKYKEMGISKAGDYWTQLFSTRFTD